MLAEADLDIVCICSFSDQHLEHAEACLRAGKHVFVEKPVGYDLEQARRFKYLAYKYSELKGAVAYSLRYRKAFIDLRALIRAGILGEILSCEISYSHSRDLPAEAKDPLRDRRPDRFFEDRGGNYISSSELVHNTHPWDLARYLLGEVREVFCTTGGGGNIEMGILWMASGALCHVLAGVMRPSKEGSNQHQIVQIHGTQGSAWLNRDRGEPYEYHATYRTDGEILPVPSTCDLPDSSHGAILRSRNLLDAIEGKAELICSLLDGAATTDLLHALWLSQRLQVKVPVIGANHTG